MAEGWIVDDVPRVVRITCNYICATMYIMRRKMNALSCLFIESTVCSLCAYARLWGMVLNRQTGRGRITRGSLYGVEGTNVIERLTTSGGEQGKIATLAVS